MMELLALAALLAGFLATLYAFDRRDRRERRERAELLNRIQAPDVSVLDSLEFKDENGQILGIEFDNDEEFAAMRQESRAAS